jgi:hypothetical protein
MAYPQKSLNIIYVLTSKDKYPSFLSSTTHECIFRERCVDTQAHVLGLQKARVFLVLRAILHDAALLNHK